MYTFVVIPLHYWWEYHGNKLGVFPWPYTQGNMLISVAQVSSNSNKVCESTDDRATNLNWNYENDYLWLIYHTILSITDWIRIPLSTPYHRDFDISLKTNQ